MTDVDVPVALRRDHAILDVNVGADRDRARTPMPWDDSPGSGFTGPGVTPWLPLAEHPDRTLLALSPGGPIPRTPLGERRPPPTPPRTAPCPASATSRRPPFRFPSAPR